jgi:peptidoglycan/LPS O-acetylase OafA/YrhL
MGKSVTAGIINAHTLAVDTFFVMGALLMTWSTLRDCEKQQLNIPRMIWRRYIRYTPVYAALILIVVSLAKFLQGPFYTEQLRESCIQNWWLTLLHVQNYLQQKNMCLNHGWYLSADFQLFIISPFIILILHKYGKKLLIIPALLFLATVIYIISISIVFEIGMPAPSTSQNYLDLIYFPTHSRAGPWFVGIILGYCLFRIQGKTIVISKFLNAFMWIFSLSVLFSMAYLQVGFTSATDVIHRAYHISFLALHRNLWAIALCWIIFACQNLKTGGIIRWFLSLPQWQPISRMGLSMYLVGAVYQVMMILNQRVPLYMNLWHVVSDFFLA